MDEQNMLIIERQVDLLMDKAVAWIIDEAAPILATLRDEQIDHAERQLDKRLEKTREELAKPVEERIRDRQEKFVEAIEDWTGPLSDPQKKAIRSYVAAMPDEAADGLRADGPEEDDEPDAQFRRMPVLFRDLETHGFSSC